MLRGHFSREESVKMPLFRTAYNLWSLVRCTYVFFFLKKISIITYIFWTKWSFPIEKNRIPLNCRILISFIWDQYKLWYLWMHICRQYICIPISPTIADYVVKYVLHKTTKLFLNMPQNKVFGNFRQ